MSYSRPSRSAPSTKRSLLDAECIDDLGHDDHAARKHRPALLGDRVQVQLARMTDLGKPLQQQFVARPG